MIRSRLIPGLVFAACAGGIAGAITGVALAQETADESASANVAIDLAVPVADADQAEKPKLPSATSPEAAKIDAGGFFGAKAQLKSAPPVRGWLRTFANEALPGDLAIEMPEYYESTLESDLRGVIARSLADRGIGVDAEGEDDGFRISYSAEVRKPGEGHLPQSRLQLAPDRGGDLDVGTARMKRPEEGVKPVISFGLNDPPKLPGPSVRVSIIVMRGRERAWAGYAEAPLEGASRSEIARALGATLMRYWGVNADVSDARFSDGPVMVDLPLQTSD